MKARHHDASPVALAAAEIRARVRFSAGNECGYRVARIWDGGAILARGPLIEEGWILRVELDHAGMQLGLDCRVVRVVDLGGHRGLEVAFAGVDPAVRDLLEELALRPPAGSGASLPTPR